MFVQFLLRDSLILLESFHVVYSIQPFVVLDEDVLEKFFPILFHSIEKKNNSYLSVQMTIFLYTEDIIRNIPLKQMIQ